MLKNRFYIREGGYCGEVHILLASPAPSAADPAIHCAPAESLEHVDVAACV